MRRTNAAGAFQEFAIGQPSARSRLRPVAPAAQEKGKGCVRKRPDLRGLTSESLVLQPFSEFRTRMLCPGQIPLAGMDTKWLEARTTLVADLIAALQLDDAEGGGFHQRCGLKEAPQIVRVRLLDQTLRDHVGGLGDIAAPIGEIAALRLPISRILHRGECANRTLLQREPRFDSLHGTGVWSQCAGRIALVGRGGMHLLGRSRYPRLCDFESTTGMPAQRGVSSDGRVNFAEKQKLVGRRGEATQRTRAAIPDRGRTDGLPGTEAATLGSECSAGAGTYCLGRGMAGIAPW
jgi:hypothetical protein